MGDARETLGEEIASVLHELAHKKKRRLLLLIDEVPVFVLQLLKLDPSGERARTFLHWFRELRQKPQFSAAVRWLVAGSIGLDNVARRMSLSRTINDFYVFDDLGAFKEEQARELLDQWSQTFNLPLEGARRSTLEATLARHVSDPERRDEKLRYLIDVLQSDGYLVEAGGRYRFRSGMLRDFWLHRFGPGIAADPGAGGGGTR